VADEVDRRPELPGRVDPQEPEGHAEVGEPLEPGVNFMNSFGP
jgi:hypothetical protein